MTIVPDSAPDRKTSLQSTNPVADAATAAKSRFASFDGVPPQNEIVRCATAAYLEAVDPDDPPSPETVEKQLLSVVNGVLKMVNPKASTSQEKLPLQRTLTYWQVAQVLIRLHHVTRITPADKDMDREYDLLTMYVAGGRDRGIYTASEDDIRAMARRYNTQLSLNEFKEVLAVLREDSPRTTICLDRDLVAVYNGIFNYSSDDREITLGGKTFQLKAKSLHTFDPALIFLAKSYVSYDPDADSPVLTLPDGTAWEIEAWIEEFFDQPGQEGMAELIWEILSAIIRPHVRWGKSAWFYSEQGNNGKGTLCSLARNVCGTRSHTSIPLSEFGKDFALEPLIRANAVVVDENDVGTFIDKAANLKAIVTNDVIQINRKYRMPVAYQFWGFMIQCLNEFPKVKDRSESFYRRQLFVPFTKSFTGRERKEIKDDFLQRPEVLQYVLKRVLHMSHYELSEPPATKIALAEYREFNDPVREFWAEFESLLVWDLLPWVFLYDLFCAWYRRMHPAGNPGPHKTFVKDLRAIVHNSPEWYAGSSDKPDSDKHKSGTRMSAPEPLIAEYELTQWYDPYYAGSDRIKRSQPDVKASYRGLLRMSVPAATTSTSDDDANDLAA